MPVIGSPLPARGRACGQVDTQRNSAERSGAKASNTVWGLRGHNQVWRL